MDNTKIDWADSSWNPVSGCYHGCEYCYARTMAQRFAGCDPIPEPYPDTIIQNTSAKGKTYELYKRLTTTTKFGEKEKTAPYPFGFAPTLHAYKLDDPSRWRKPRNIFVCSMSDLFGDFIPDRWLDLVFEACEKAPQHNYLFLTKNVDRYTQYGVPIADNMWYGTTVTSNADFSRVNRLPHSCNTFVSFEPLLEDIHADERAGILRFIDWAIIGAETGKRANKPSVQKEWVDNITKAFTERRNRPVLMKNSLIPIMGDNMLRQFPEQLSKIHHNTKSFASLP